VRWPPSPPWPPPPRVLAEHLESPAEPLALLLDATRPAAETTPAAVAARAARALLDLPEVPAQPPEWLAPHQRPAAQRLTAILARYGGAVLADAVGLGKSHVALAVARMLGDPFTLVVPAVLVDQWRELLRRLEFAAPIVTHEGLSRPTVRQSDRPTLVLVDEAHRFRNPETVRYRNLARRAVGARILLITATPIHNRPADLLHLFRLFLGDHALAGLGLPSLRRAARGDCPTALVTVVAARLVVARTRARVGEYAAGSMLIRFPARVPGRSLRASPAPDDLLHFLVAGIRRLRGIGTAGPLFRLVLLRRLASSLAALRTTLRRYEGLLDLAARAAAEGRTLSPHEARGWLAPDEGGPQLALFPLMLPAGPGPSQLAGADLPAVAELLHLVGGARVEDPKADALASLLVADARKTIVFADARATVHHLRHRLGPVLRVAAVVGDAGYFGAERVSRREVIAAFAPLAQGAADPPSALHTDVLLATDLVGEGLNLQDAARVVHYDLPWSPARLAQRVGRIDRLGSPHTAVETVTFLPPADLAAALASEERLAHKLRAQVAAGAAQAETTEGSVMSAGFDWCDRLQRLATGGGTPTAPPGAFAAVRGDPAAVLVVRIGTLIDAIVVEGDRPRSDPAQATSFLEQAAHLPCAVAGDRVARALRVAAPLVRARLAAVAQARWRAADRDRLGRRLIPWVLAAARRAAQRRDPGLLRELDGLVSRLSLGMTAGEEILLEDVLQRHRSIGVRDLLAWHALLPPVTLDHGAPDVELVAALVVGEF
jgi:superfamily II DNA or RNA helicase